MRLRSWSRSIRRPSRSPWPSRLVGVVIAITAAFIVVAIARSLRRHDSLTEWRQALEVTAGRPAWPEWSSAWPALPNPPPRRHQLPQDLRGAYAYAVRQRDMLQHIPCYCGCVREGHRSNLSCFVSGFRPDGTPNWTDHSFSCPMCVQIARETMLMSVQGTPLTGIRAEIEKHYRMIGEPTNTPPPGDAQSRR